MVKESVIQLNAMLVKINKLSIIILNLVKNLPNLAKKTETNVRKIRIVYSVKHVSKETVKTNVYSQLACKIKFVIEDIAYHLFQLLTNVRLSDANRVTLA